MRQTTGENTLSPILKWPGGKEKELKYIIPQLPHHINNYYEPFVGGGAVYTAITAKKYFINDKSNELISLYKSILDSSNDIFFDTIEEIIHNWNLLTEVIKTNREFFIITYTNFSRSNITEEKRKIFYLNLLLIMKNSLMVCFLKDLILTLQIL